MSKLRHAFTMIELIMVIVILGIIGMIVTEVLAQAYKGAFYQERYAEREVELERTLTIIEKRLKDALVDSIVLLDGSPPCQPVGMQDMENDYTAAFIMVDRESMNGLWDGNRSGNGWSEEGRINVVGANTVLTSPDSDFSITNSIIDKLYPSKDILNAAIYRYPMISDACNDFRWTTGTTGTAMDKIIAFNPATPTQVEINGTVGLNTQQMYRLASTAIAFKRIPGPTGNTGDGTLVMYSNFQPWDNQGYADGSVTKVADHVSHFAIRMDSGSAHSMVGNPSLTGAFYRINVCMQVVSDTENTSNANDFHDQICKEKSVYVR